MRIVPKEARRIRQRDLAHHFGDPGATLVRVLAKVMRFEYLTELGPDAQGGVEGRRGLLWDRADDGATQAGAHRRAHHRHTQWHRTNRAHPGRAASPRAA